MDDEDQIVGWRHIRRSELVPRAGALLTGLNGTIWFSTNLRVVLELAEACDARYIAKVVAWKAVTREEPNLQGFVASAVRVIQVSSLR